MLFAWLKRRRRRKVLAEPFPAQWLAYLHANVPHYQLLDEAEQAKLRDDLRIFIAEKSWEGCGGLTITDEIKVTIAAQACLLVLATDDDDYDRVMSILVYPHGYLAPTRSTDPGGIVTEGAGGRLGEAWYRGPVILAWDAVRSGANHPGDGSNVVFHEFAHQLDMLDGAIDGTPPLAGREQYRKWREVMRAEYERLVRESEHGQATLLDAYGTTDEAEFFAVATECFFERPVAMARRHPKLYEVLQGYYRQDPARRCAGKPCSLA